MPEHIHACLYRGAAAAVLSRTAVKAEGPHGAAPTAAKSAPPHPPTGLALPVGSGSREPTPRPPFSEDKKRYNKFNYHLRNAGDEYQKQWAVVKSKEFQDPESFDKFVEMISALPASERRVRKRAIQDFNETELGKTWTPWKEAADKEGEDVLPAMVEAGTIECRRHTGLPADCAIKWPRNQQVRRVVETETEGRNYSKEDKSESNFEGAKLEEASEQFDAAWAKRDLSKAVSGGSAHHALDTSSAGPSAGKSEAQVKKDMEALQHIKKAHNAWDRIAREVTGALAISGDHPNTKGGKVEMDLTGALAEGKSTDAELMKMEVKAMHPSNALTDEDISVAAALTTKIQGYIKECKRLNNALRSWFKV